MPTAKNQFQILDLHSKIHRKTKVKLDIDPERDDDASPMSSYGCMLRPT